MNAPLTNTDDMSGRIYEYPERRKSLVSFRISEDARERLDSVIKLWRLQAELEKRDPEVIDLSYVGSRLLNVGIDAAWAETLKLVDFAKPPETDEQWKKFTEALTKAFKK